MMLMVARPFTRVASVFLAVITLLHLLRVAAGWQLVIHHWHVPMWINLILAAVTAFLSHMLWRDSRR